MSESIIPMKTQPQPSAFDDNNFLQDWLEKRYGCGFAQMVMDDVTHTAELGAPIEKAPYDRCADDAVNDNFIPRHRQSQQAAR
jgi:hypothetical protein